MATREVSGNRNVAEVAKLQSWAAMLPIQLLVVAASLLMVLPFAGCDKPTRGATNHQFDSIRTMVTRGKYQEAIPKLEAFLKENPKSKDASRAGLFLGKAHLGLGDLDAASAAFEATIRDYPNSLEAHKSRYKLAVISLLQDDPEGALKRFSQLAEKPDGPLAPEAAAMTSYLKKRIKKPAEAAEQNED